MGKKIVLWLICACAVLGAQEPQPDILTYEGGSVQINSEVNSYENLRAHVPIEGSVMVTHKKSQQVDENSFRLGNQRLDVEFVRSAQMFFDSPLTVSIYKFRIEAMKAGVHTLPPIVVKVGGKEYQAPPLILQIQP